MAAIIPFPQAAVARARGRRPSRRRPPRAPIVAFSKPAHPLLDLFDRFIASRPDESGHWVIERFCFYYLEDRGLEIPADLRERFRAFLEHASPNDRLNWPGAPSMIDEIESFMLEAIEERRACQACGRPR